MDPLDTLLAKDRIRDLALLYARAIDRQDLDLLRTLYTADAIDHHGDRYDGGVDGYIAFLAASLPHMPIGGHFICNHLIEVAGDTGEGEVYAIAWHVIPDGQGGLAHDIQGVRYLDRYALADGRWRFAERTLSFDMKLRSPAAPLASADPAADPSYAALAARLFARGPRE